MAAPRLASTLLLALLASSSIHAAPPGPADSPLAILEREAEAELARFRAAGELDPELGDAVVPRSFEPPVRPFETPSRTAFPAAGPEQPSAPGIQPPPVEIRRAAPAPTPTPARAQAQTPAEPVAPVDILIEEPKNSPLPLGSDPVASPVSIPESPSELPLPIAFRPSEPSGEKFFAFFPQGTMRIEVPEGYAPDAPPPPPAPVSARFIRMDGSAAFRISLFAPQPGDALSAAASAADRFKARCEADGGVFELVPATLLPGETAFRSLCLADDHFRSARISAVPAAPGFASVKTVETFVPDGSASVAEPADQANERAALASPFAFVETPAPSAKTAQGSKPPARKAPAKPKGSDR